MSYKPLWERRGVWIERRFGAVYLWRKTCWNGAQGYQLWPLRKRQEVTPSS